LLVDCFYRVAGSGPGWSERAYSYAGPWKLLMITTMSFQDLYNYDFATMSDSKTPVATQEGEMTFCAYNGGRWRQIVEHSHRTASLAEWNRTHGRHPIYANGKEVVLDARQSARSELVQIENQRTPA
jgi:7,8-dihydro-6-hydroxymethylpterin dimethyltransferase